MLSVQGTVERITYRNEDSLYTVARVACEERGPAGRRRQTITVVGTFPFISVGETLLMKGEWTYHPEYGSQFRVESYESIVPATVKGIEKYLGSGLIKGIGPVTAKKLVAHFGTKTLDVIEHEPERLTEVEGIGEKKAEAITQAFEEQKEIRRVMVFLADHGVTPGLAIKIFRHYGNASIQAVRENPYRLADEIHGVGFKTADKIAAELGIEPVSQERITAGIVYVLNELASDGHVYYPEDALIKEVASVLEVEEALVKDAIPVLEERGSIVREMIQGQTAVYLAYLYRAEVNVAGRLSKLVRVKPRTVSGNVQKLIKEMERRDSISLNDAQKEAVEKAVKSSVVVLTGGPGTGKTTTVRTMLRVFEAEGFRVALAAPTGRAAKRMAETTGREAKTIHRLLGVNFTQGYMAFERNESAPIDADVIILDETSMIDVLLMSNFLAAVRPGTRLVLVGDVDQLPSVGPGSLLKDVIASGVAEVVRLTEIFRQAQLSMIVTNAHRVNRGTMPIFNKNLVEGADADFFFIREEDPEKVTELVTELVAWRLPRYLKCNPIDDIQGMAPMRRTVTGVDNLNLLLREALNPKGRGRQETRMGAFILREGDKVMQIRNNYDKMVFNGDIGRVVKIDPEEQEVVVAFDESDGLRRVAYEQHELDELVLSYAISVHKSQGSEYPVVVMPITTQHYVMLQRNLLYTAITRAKRMVVLVGTLKALAIAVKNDTQDTRFSGLSERLVCAASEDP